MKKMKKAGLWLPSHLAVMLLALVLLVGVSPAASAAGPLFHSKDYPAFQFKPPLPEVTVEALCEANTYEALLEKHGGFGVETFPNTAYLGEEGYSFFYGTEEYNFIRDAQETGDQPVSASLTTASDVYRMDVSEDGEVSFGTDWFAGPGWEKTVYSLKDGAMALDEEVLLGSVIVSVEDNGDGTLNVVLTDTPAVAAEEENTLPEVPAEEAAAEDSAAAEKAVEEGAVPEEPYAAEQDPWLDGPYFPYDEYAYLYDDWDDRYGGWNDAYVWGDRYAYDDWDDRYGGWNDAYVWGDPYADRSLADDTAAAAPEADPAAAQEAEAQDGTGDPAAAEEWYNTPAEEAPTADTWYDNAASWYDDHPYQPVTVDSTEPEIVTSLTVDAATLEILKVEQTRLSIDGDEELLMAQNMTYTLPDSAILQELLSRVAQQTEEADADTRTVTVVYDPGTPEELVVSRTARKGDFLYTSFRAGYQLCEDLEGTPFSGSDGMSDVTIYAFPEELVYLEAEGETVSVPAKDAFIPADGADVSDDGMDDMAPAEDGMIPVEDDMAPAEDDMPFMIVEEPVFSSGLDNVEAAPVDSFEDDFAAANMAIFQANSLDAILMNHSSVEYRLVYTDDTAGKPNYVYETRDMAYAESPSTAVYVGNDTYYEITDNAAGSELFYVFDFCNGYDPIANAGYEIVPETYEQWWNSAEETPLDCYVENGEVHLISLSSPEKSREFVETYLQRSYQGEIVRTEAVADAETYELIRFVYMLDEQGELTFPLTYEVAYDLPEPRASQMLRSIAERDAAEVVTISLVLNPGTPEEEKQTKTVPTGSSVVYIADQWMDMFEDPECTVPAGQWDKLTDHTYYMLPAAGSAGET